MDIISPKDGVAFDQITPTQQKDLPEMVQQAQQAQLEWAASAFKDRARIIERFNNLLSERSDRLAKTQALETGKPKSQALGEIKGTRDRIQFFLDRTEDVTAKREVRNHQGTQEFITFEPLGTIGNISAWNYPYFVGTNVIIPALLTGNSVLYKPSEWAALVGQDIGNLMKDAGVPSGVFQVIQGEGSVGAALLDEQLDGIFFTGSFPTGQKIAAKGQKNLAKMALELGGKDPAYVASTSKVKEAAAALADGSFYNAGQSCCAVERIYVHRDHYQEFLDAFLETVQSFKMGDPLEDTTYLGPLARAPQRNVLLDQIKDATSKGAEICTGGQSPDGPGWYFEPTVLTNVDHSMSVMKEESFGPIIGIQKVDSHDEAQKLMQDTSYGLTASIYTEDEALARKVLGAIKCGTVYWNCCDRVSPFVPWSGRGHSGLGQTLGTMGIETFVAPKAWHWRSP